MYGLRIKTNHLQAVMDFCDSVKIYYEIWDIETGEINFSREADRDKIQDMLERRVL
jgi:ABC-type sugar transport system substrate-binding protein